MRRVVLLFLILTVFVSVSHAYTIEGNSVFIEDAQASLRVEPHTAQFQSAEGYQQEFEICNKTGVTTDLYGAYVFNYELIQAKAEYLTSEGYDWVEYEENCIYEFDYETNVNPAPNVHQAECFYINAREEKVTLFDMAFKTGNVETGTIQYDVSEWVKNWSNVTSLFEKKQIENMFAYTYTEGKTVLANSCETWRITYKPNEEDKTEKWDLWLWAGEEWDCILTDSCLKTLKLDPWWSGIGSEGDPFIITDCNQLQNIDSYTLATADSSNDNQYFELGNNIDCSGFGDFDPIGSNTLAFHGNFDGNNYSISRITINEDDVQDSGLFALLHNASVKDVA